MTKLLAALALSAAVLPTAAFAATYEYVTADGNLKTVTASSSAEALIQAPDIAAHSGVMLIEDHSDMISTDTNVSL